ncbi:MAG: DUF5804 family protein [Natrialbaceae archaeon]|nr:DUF5804 family protein [Natrialbaceae archaeon]
MTRVCLVGAPDVTLRFELLSRETSRDALSTYTLTEPFENALAVQTVSVGAAVSLLNDLQWYIVRFVDEALVLDPSISETEWLSRDLATGIRNSEVDPHETGEYLKIFGVEYPEPESTPPDEDPPDPGPGQLVEPLYARRTDGEVPEYDLRDVEETIVVRLSREEFVE